MADHDSTTVDLVAAARTEHSGSLVSHNGRRYGWRCTCRAGRGFADSLYDWEKAAEELHAHENAAIADALAAAGRLLPEGGQTREEYGYRYRGSGRDFRRPVGAGPRHRRRREDVTPYFGKKSHRMCSEATGHQCRKPSGRVCVEEECSEPAGTLWGPMWCADHDAERLDRVGEQLRQLAKGGAS